MEQNNKRTILWVVLIIIVLAVVYGISNRQGTTGSKEPIKIGVISPLTGEIAAIGENVKTAIEVARDEVNAAGGVNGRMIELVVEDGKCDGQPGANAASKLVNVDKVIAIIGAGCSSETLAAAPIVDQAKVPMVSSISTNPKITGISPYVLRFVPSDAYQGKVGAEYAVETLGKKKIALLSCLSDWCTGLHDVFKSRAEALGATIVADERNQQDDRDFRTEITKIKAAKPDLVYVPEYPEATIVILRQMKELGLSVQLLGADGWSDPKIPTELGAVADGARYTEPASTKLPDAFVAEMNKRTGGQEIHSYAARAYDILHAMVQIMTTVGTDSTAIKDALHQLTNYHGIADTYTLGPDGDMTTASYTVKEYRGGKIVVVQ